MLRDAEQPEKSWQDIEANLAPNPPFYASGDSEVERDLYAIERCEKARREAKKMPDMAGGYYYFCAEKEPQND